MTAKLKCAVIGAGIVGASAAYALLKRGADVEIFEQFDLFHAHGSSHGPTRLFRLAYFEHPDYVPLLRESIVQWRALEAEADETLFHQIGVLMTGVAQGNLIAGVRRAASKYGVAINELTRKNAGARYPWFHYPDGYDILFEPEAGFLRADRILRHLINSTSKMGGVLRANTPIINWAASAKGVELLTQDDRGRFDRLIIAPGAWGSDLLKLDNIKIKPMRKTLYWLAPGDKTYSLDRSFPPFAIDQANGRFYYGFPAIDEDGVKLGEHTGGAPMTSPTDDTPAPSDEAAGVKAFLREFMPSAPHKFTKEQQCLYEMSPDGNFIIDTHPSDPRVALAAGLSGHGFKFGPVIGEALADLVTKGETQPVFDFLKLDRFGDYPSGL